MASQKPTTYEGDVGVRPEENADIQSEIWSAVARKCFLALGKATRNLAVNLCRNEI